MKTFKGACHCGNVEFEFEIEGNEITDGIRCNCSICKRLACVHSLKVEEKNLRLVKGKDSLNIYRWGDFELPITSCKNCGVYVYYNTPVQCRVNLGCVDEVDTFDLNIHFFDGKNEL